MNAKQILNFVQSMSQSKGSYSHIYDALANNPEALAYLESQNFSGPVDLIFFLES